MNRRARRAAAARARRASRRTGYLHRLLGPRAQGALANLRGKVVHGVIQHEPWCRIYQGGACNCVPDISLHPDGGGDVIIVDEDGQTKKIVAS